MLTYSRGASFRRISTRALRPTIALGAALALILAPGNLAADGSKAEAEANKLAKDIGEFLDKNRRDPSGPTIQWRSADQPGAYAQPLELSDFPTLRSLEAENKDRALKALDDVIDQEALREFRFQP